jgi:hypothetical protein
MKRRLVPKVYYSAFVIHLIACCANASQIDDLERDLNEFHKQVINRSKSNARFSSVFGIPSGTVGGHGSAFMSLMAATLPNGATKSNPFDASAILGFSVGQAEKLALGLNVGIISVNPVGHKQTIGFGEDGNLNIKIAKKFEIFNQQRVDLALGLNNYISWGEAQKLPGRGYIALTAPYTAKSGRAFTFSVGRYQNNDSFSDYFMGIGAGIIENMSVSAGLTHDSLTLGANILNSISIKNSNHTYQVGFGVSGVGDANERFILTLSKPMNWSWPQ